MGLGGRKGVGRPGCGRSSSSSATPPMATVVQEPIRVGMRLVLIPTAKASRSATTSSDRRPRQERDAVLQLAAAHPGSVLLADGASGPRIPGLDVFHRHPPDLMLLYREVLALAALAALSLKAGRRMRCEGSSKLRRSRKPPKKSE